MEVAFANPKITLQQALQDAEKECREWGGEHRKRAKLMDGEKKIVGKGIKSWAESALPSAADGWHLQWMLLHDP